MTFRKRYLNIAKAGLSLCLAAIIMAGWTTPASADEIVRDSVEVYYKVGKSRLDGSLAGNQASLDSLMTRMKDRGLENVSKIEIFGGASPEGPATLNQRLSLGRAESLLDYINRGGELPDSVISVENDWWDWKGLRDCVLADPNVPDREEVLGLLNFVASFETGAITDREQTGYLRQLMRLGNGRAYRYMSRTMFPKLRRARMVMEYLFPEEEVECADTVVTSELVVDEIEEPVIDPEPEIDAIYQPAMERKPFYMALKTNMLYDAAAIPNLHAEFYLGKGWSLTGGGMYAWWSYDRRHRYWRVYGGELGLRRWFGKSPKEKPLTGHHLGIYGGALTFDFEMGGIGYMGGKPKGTLLDRCLGYGGVEYGYSLPVARRLNIDFSLGVGYMGGKYIKYEPYLTAYKKKGEYRISYFGPTKAEISLVWLIGSGNINRKKGGDQ